MLLALNSDMHSPQGLEQMVYGVGRARREQVEPDMVLNAMALEDVLRILRG